MFAEYTLTFWAVWLIAFTIVIQALIASVAHRKQKHFIPGVVDSQLGHDSFVFRSHRTHQNSLENSIPMLIPVLLAIFVGVNATTLAVLVWVYALARLLHMVLYYGIATEKNPSPRSYFYLIGLLANIVLLGAIAVKLCA